MKTKIVLLTSAAILAALFFSGIVFAEGEVPQAPAAEAPQAAAVDTPQVAPPEAPAPAEAPVTAETEAPAEPAPEVPAGDTAAVPLEEESSALPEAELPANEAPVEAALPADEEPLIAADPAAIETPALAAGDTTESAPAVTEESLPELVLVDPAGAPLDMASQETADAISTADPYYTVDGITYRFSETLNYCSNNFPGDPHCFDPGSADPVINAIPDAIEYIWDILGKAPDDGKIYVKKATYTSDVTINGSDHPVLATITGLIGEADEGGVFPTINGNVTIRQLTSGFILSGFTINGRVNIDGVTGTLALTDLNVSKDLAEVTGGGIRISAQKGNVVMTNVTSSHNVYTGAEIENTAGGNVTITNSAFDDNGTTNNVDGLNIWTSGVVTINGVSVSRNYENGIYVYGFSSLTVKNAVLNGYVGDIRGDGLDASTTKAAPVLLQYVTANYNVWTGITISTAGSISLSSVDALYNQTGIKINKSGIGTVTLNTVRASNNSLTGIDISSTGAITLTETSANNNGVGVRLILPGTLSMTNVTANNNSGDGFFVNGGKVITIRNLTAISNNSTNSYLQHNGTDGFGLEVYPLIVAGSSFTLDTATINENNNGMIVGAFYNSGNPANTLTSLANVTIRNLTASSNLGFGLSVSRTKGSVSLTNIQANGNMDGDGVHIESGSTVLLTSITASGNGENGLNIKGVGEGYTYVSTEGSHVATSVKSPTAITITSPTSALLANNFDGNGANGLQIATASPVSLSNFSASANTGSGLIIEDYSYCEFDGGEPWHCISKPVIYPGNVTIGASILNFNNTLSNNSTGDGININSKGSVSISKTNVESSGSQGISITNTYASGNLPITLTNCLANGNGLSGIEIETNGAVTLTNTGAAGNTIGHGAYIANTLSTASSAVTIKSNLTTTYYDFSANGLDGIYISSKGPVSVGNVLACENTNYGLNIDRNAGTGAISVMRSTFDHNTFGGARIYTTPGGVTLTDVTASYNDPTVGGTEYSGVYIENGGTVVVKSSTTAGVYAFSHNTDHGLDIISTGSISVSNVLSEGNGNTNINLENHAALAASPKPVNVSRSTANSSTNGDGIYITTKGSVTLNTLTANSNLNGAGLYVDAGDGFVVAPAAVTLTGSRNEFSGNNTNGIFIATEGNILLANVIADDTISGEGINLYNAGYSDAIGNVTITAGTNFWNSTSNNHLEGLLVNSNGIVSISRLRSNDNGDYGMEINNFYPNPLVKNVTLTNVEVNRNGGIAGLAISSLGAVTLNSTRADSNVNRGIVIQTNGNIILNGVSASFNSLLSSTTYGAYINNSAGTGNSVSILSPANFRSEFNENNGMGLAINTNGSVTIINTDIRDNKTNGINLQSQSAGLTIRNTLTTREMAISGNDGYGILAEDIRGAITLRGKISFSGNGNTGAYLVNSGVPDLTPMPVILSSISASGNQGAGIYIDSKGTVTLTSITAVDNQCTIPSFVYGVYIHNNYTGLQGNVTINGSNIFSENNGDGLILSTNGLLSISGVRAENNAKYGLNLTSLTPGKSIILSNIVAQYNGDTGLYLAASGQVTISNVRSNINGTTGVSADGININMTGTYHTYINNSTAIGNTGSGIEINVPKSLLHLLGTFFFGNNTDNVDSELDLYYSPS